METLAILLIGLVIFEVAAWRWGVDSTDGVDSAEWQRRRDWRGYSRPGDGRA
jgi:hypothetical protein